MYVKVKPKICVKLMIINCESHHCRYIFSTMVWWLSLGFKDDSVFLSVDSGMGLQPQSGFAVRAEEAGGTLEGYCCCRSRSSSVAVIVGCKLFCLSLLAVMHLLCMSACQWGQTWAAMLRSEGLMPHHFRLLFNVSL